MHLQAVHCQHRHLFYTHKIGWLTFSCFWLFSPDIGGQLKALYGEGKVVLNQSGHPKMKPFFFLWLSMQSSCQKPILHAPKVQRSTSPPFINTISLLLKTISDWKGYVLAVKEADGPRWRLREIRLIKITHAFKYPEAETDCVRQWTTYSLLW